MPPKLLDPRDGPTVEWLRHHSATERRGKESSGKRLLSKAEELMEANEITPEEFAGCRRFTRDYEMGVVGSSSTLMGGSGGSGAGHPSEIRLDHHRYWREAAAAVDATVGRVRNPNALGYRPSDVIRMFAQEDAGFREIGRRIGEDDRRTKVIVLRCTLALSTHYAAVDKERGCSTTPRTKAGARRLMDPDDRPKVVN